MAKKGHKILWIIGLGGAAYLAYDWWKNKNAVIPTTATNPTGMSDQTPTTTLPVATQSASTQQSSILQPVDLSGKVLPAGISQDMYNKVYEWAISTGKPTVKDFAAALVPAEYQGMYNLITVEWPSGKATAAGTNFWNNLRSKYDPQHKYW